jgi:hypothetical protein
LSQFDSLEVLVHPISSSWSIDDASHCAQKHAQALNIHSNKYSIEGKICQSKIQRVEIKDDLFGLTLADLKC